MAEDKKDESQQDIIVGLDDEHSPTVLTFSVPIKTLSEMKNGTAVCRGSFDEIKMLALQQIQRIRAKRAQTNGIIKPGLVS